MRAVDSRHLAIVTDTQDAVISRAVAAVPSGTVERFVDPYIGDRIGYRWHGVGGHDVIIIIPSELEDDDALADVRAFVAARLGARIP